MPFRQDPNLDIHGHYVSESLEKPMMTGSALDGGQLALYLRVHEYTTVFKVFT